MDTPGGRRGSTLSTTPTEKPAETGRPASAGRAPWSVGGGEADTRRVIEKAAGDEPARAGRPTWLAGASLKLMSVLPFDCSIRGCLAMFKTPR